MGSKSRSKATHAGLRSSAKASSDDVPRRSNTKYVFLLGIFTTVDLTNRGNPLMRLLGISTEVKPITNIACWDVGLALGRLGRGMDVIPKVPVFFPLKSGFY